jgi:hypothetical protein
VTRHGPQFETILKDRNYGQPGWEFLFAAELEGSNPGARYYRLRLEAEMQRQIVLSSKRCESIYSELTSVVAAAAAAAAASGAGAEGGEGGGGGSPSAVRACMRAGAPPSHSVHELSVRTRTRHGDIIDCDCMV